MLPLFLLRLLHFLAEIMVKSFSSRIAALVAVPFISGTAVHAQTANDAPNNSLSSSASVNANLPKISVNNFFLGFAEHPDPGKGGGISVNQTDILTVDIDFSSGVRFEIAPRTDWYYRREGFANSQYFGIKDLNLQVPTKFMRFQFGAIGLESTYAGTPGLKDSQRVRDELAEGGPGPGLMGVRGSGTLDTMDLNVQYDVFFGTGDRGLTGSLVAKDKFNSLCQANQFGCGVVAGVRTDVNAKAFPELNFHFKETRVGNGGSLRGEWRSTFGLDYKHALGNDYLATAEGEFTHATNYHGGTLPLDIYQSTEAVSKTLGRGFSLKAYGSVTYSIGAINDAFAIGGLALTKQLKGNDFLSIEGYAGRPNQNGFILTFSKKL